LSSRSGSEKVLNKYLRREEKVKRKRKEGKERKGELVRFPLL
jgi:hypothetical protein